MLRCHRPRSGALRGFGRTDGYVAPRSPLAGEGTVRTGTVQTRKGTIATLGAPLDA